MGAEFSNECFELVHVGRGECFQDDHVTLPDDHEPGPGFESQFLANILVDLPPLPHPLPRPLRQRPLRSIEPIEAFDQLFAAESLALGAEVRGKDVLPLLSGDLRPEMVEALRRVKENFKTGCITNNLPANAIGSHSGRSLYVAEVMALFDHIIESAKIGLRKPDPQIYRLMTEQLNVDPKNCVYLDDLGVNLKPAREMGMTTIKVVDAPPVVKGATATNQSKEATMEPGLRVRVPERGPITILTVEPGDVVGWSAVVPPFRAGMLTTAFSYPGPLRIPTRTITPMLANTFP